MLPYPLAPTNDRPPKVDGILGQVLIDAGYHSPSPLLPPPTPQPYGVQSNTRMPLLIEGRFMDAFVSFSNLTGIRLNEQDFFIEGHQVNPWELYRAVSLRNGFDSVTMNGEWSMVGVDLGFHPISCGDPHPLAHCTPAVAHQLHQLYQDTLRHFDQAYSRGIITELLCYHTRGQRYPAAQPQALQRHYQPLAYQPTEADYQALLESSSVMTFEEAKYILLRFCDVSAAELDAHRVPQHVIAYVEHNREYLKWLAQNPRFSTNFTPIGSPQSVHQNLFNGVQAIPHSSLHIHPQLQQRRSDWESTYEDATSFSLPQQQIIRTLRAQVQEGHMTQQQALDRLAMMQASPYSFKEQSAPQQWSPGFNASEVPSGNAHQQMDALSQHSQVSINDQMNVLRRVTRAQEPSHARQFNMLVPVQQLQNDSGTASHMGQDLNPSGIPHGPGSLQQNFIQASPSVSHANPRPSSTPLASQTPQPGAQQVSGPPGNIADVPLPQLHALSVQLLHVVMEGEKYLQGTGSSGEGDIQQHFRARVQLNKRRLCALHEVINAKVRASGDLTPVAVNVPAQSMGTLSSPYTGVQITGSIACAGAQDHAIPVSTNTAAMNGVRIGSMFTQSPSVSQIRRPTQEDLVAAKRSTEEKKRMAFSSVPNFDRVTYIQPIPESDVQEYQRNLERLDQVLVNIEKYIHLAFAVLKKEEVVGRLFSMMAFAKSQLEELKKPNPRYALELHTIRGMIQEADNMDKGLKAVLQRVQTQTMPRDGVPSAPQPPPRLDSILILPPPTSTRRRDLPQGDDLEPARSLEGAVSHRDGLFDEEARISMSKLEI